MLDMSLSWQAPKHVDPVREDQLHNKLWLDEVKLANVDDCGHYLSPLEVEKIIKQEQHSCMRPISFN